MFKYKKVVVIGCSGAGKSTFSRKLAKVTHLPLVYLDMLYWNADCTHITRAEFLDKQKKILLSDSWILDGNFRNTLEYRIKAADVIFFFDLPVDVCIKGVLTRGRREDMPCDLPPDEELIAYIKNYETDCKPIVLNLFQKYPNKKVITFYSHTDADVYIDKLIREESIYGFDNKNE